MLTKTISGSVLLPNPDPLVCQETKVKLKHLQRLRGTWWRPGSLLGRPRGEPESPRGPGETSAFCSLQPRRLILSSGLGTGLVPVSVLTAFSWEKFPAHGRSRERRVETECCKEAEGGHVNAAQGSRGEHKLDPRERNAAFPGAPGPPGGSAPPASAALGPHSGPRAMRSPRPQVRPGRDPALGPHPGPRPRAPSASLLPSKV